MSNIKTILGNEIGIINEFLNIKTNKILKEIISNDLINYYNSILNKYEEIIALVDYNSNSLNDYQGVQEQLHNLEFFQEKLQQSSQDLIAGKISPMQIILELGSLNAPRNTKAELQAKEESLKIEITSRKTELQKMIFNLQNILEDPQYQTFQKLNFVIPKDYHEELDAAYTDLIEREIKIYCMENLSHSGAPTCAEKAWFYDHQLSYAGYRTLLETYLKMLENIFQYLFFKSRTIISADTETAFIEAINKKHSFLRYIKLICLSIEEVVMLPCDEQNVKIEVELMSLIGKFFEGTLSQDEIKLITQETFKDYNITDSQNELVTIFAEAVLNQEETPVLSRASRSIKS